MDGLPDFALSDLFPFEGDMRVKPLDPPVVPEPARGGEGGDDCRACAGDDTDFAWTNDRWRLGVIRGLAVPIALSLGPRTHYDSPDLPDDMAAELGVLLIRIERAILGTGGIGRVHFNKWCDGGAHLHWWILGRPEGFLQQRGSFLVLWAQTLPPPPQDEVDERVAQVVAALTAACAT
jgi:hypothetical protein